MGRPGPDAPCRRQRAVAREPAVQRNVAPAPRPFGVPCAPGPSRARRGPPSRDQPPRRLRVLSPPRLGAAGRAPGCARLGDLGHAARRLPLRLASTSPARPARAARGGGPRRGRVPGNASPDLRDGVAQPPGSGPLAPLPRLGPGARPVRGRTVPAVLPRRPGVEPASRAPRGRAAGRAVARDRRAARRAGARQLPRPQDPLRRAAGGRATGAAPRARGRVPSRPGPRAIRPDPRTAAGAPPQAARRCAGHRGSRPAPTGAPSVPFHRWGGSTSPRRAAGERTVRSATWTGGSSRAETTDWSARSIPHAGDCKLVFNVRELPLAAILLEAPGMHSRPSAHPLRAASRSGARPERGVGAGRSGASLGHLVPNLSDRGSPGPSGWVGPARRSGASRPSSTRPRSRMSGRRVRVQRGVLPVPLPGG